MKEEIIKIKSDDMTLSLIRDLAEQYNEPVDDTISAALRSYIMIRELSESDQDIYLALLKKAADQYEL